MNGQTFPKYLIDQIAEGNAVLFLGSGFSFGALHPQGVLAKYSEIIFSQNSQKILVLAKYRNGALN